MHVPVLLEEAVERLVTREDGVYIDGTLGLGGHSRAILERLSGEGRLIGIDRDEEALGRAKERLQEFGSRFEAVHANYSEIKNVANQLNIEAVDGILLDLGVSSLQLDSADRGFSFSKDGPLDMRMDPSCGESAADLIARLDEKDLADILFKLGEERDSRRIARAIVREEGAHRIERTADLAAIVERAKGGRRSRIHPATKTFQALRMAVNAELDHLEAGLESSLGLLREGGRMAVITFHSIEDRITKHFFKAHAPRRISLMQGGYREEFEEPAVRILTRKPVMPAERETAGNPRSRSAKLRVAERIAA